MDKKVETAIMEMAEKYALHYAYGFISNAKNKRISFENHYEQLKFKGDYLYEVLEDFQKEPEQSELNQMNRFFKEQYVEHYLSSADEKIAELTEELNYAVEDKIYYETRRYIGEEDLIGGPVSEEERAELIIEMGEKAALYKQRLENLRFVKEEINTFIEKEKEPV